MGGSARLGRGRQGTAASWALLFASLPSSGSSSKFFPLGLGSLLNRTRCFPVPAGGKQAEALGRPQESIRADAGDFHGGLLPTRAAFAGCEDT